MITSKTSPQCLETQHQEPSQMYETTLPHPQGSIRITFYLNCLGNNLKKKLRIFIEKITFRCRLNLYARGAFFVV